MPLGGTELVKPSNDGTNGGSPAGAQSPEDRYDLRILYAIRKIVRRIDIDSRKLAAKHQITGPQLIALITVVERGPIGVAGIAKHIHLSASTMVGILDRLEDKGLVHRRRDTHDRRKVYVSATDAGQMLVAEAPYPLQYSLQEALKRLSEREQKQTATSLERLVRLLGAEEIEAAPVLKIGPLGKLPKPAAPQRERAT